MLSRGVASRTAPPKSQSRLATFKRRLANRTWRLPATVERALQRAGRLRARGRWCGDTRTRGRRLTRPSKTT
eukprot:12316880-Alexandrium_andersonii.AAC.1